MKIAQVAPLFESVPPRLYGGTERVVAYLSEALVELGHQVTLFASGDSTTSAELDAVWPAALRIDYSSPGTIIPHLVMMERVRRRAQEFDIIHFHLDLFPLSLFSRQPTPFVTTLHGRVDRPELKPVYNLFKETPLISISNAQRNGLPTANWVDTVYHGLPQHLHTPQQMTRTYLAFLGRITPVKKVEAAIRIAQQCNIPIKIAARVEAGDRAYFEQDISPLLDSPLVEYVGEIDEQQKTAFLAGALALLFPIEWPEPFGLVMIEAMACGTPVIAFPFGSVPEVIEDGVTGFIVSDEAQAVAAVHNVSQLSAVRIREQFEKRFCARQMAENYVHAYQSLIDQSSPR
ncbi:glycosyltransferase family 4 protein [Pseudomonas syringae]|uniref:glycosyltransferase family 4 protein n=1 Tax=Pseudomonas syringae TaxID=317 RepID=UPI00051620CC|nr:glycosyltransferase family 4 protein [Pseudomonas syringae]POP73868.1 glycosyltransferase family 4 protein [Pseudomonas syringae pv. syringae]